MPDLDSLQRIKSLEENVAFKALREYAEEQREGYYNNLARTLGKSGEVVDQRSLDYKRGFFGGMMWILTLPDHGSFMVELKKALEERTNQ